MSAQESVLKAAYHSFVRGHQWPLSLTMHHTVHKTQFEAFKCGTLWRRREQHPGVTLPTDLGPAKG